MRPQHSPVRFGPFRLHPVQGLSRDGREIRVTPKSLSLLQVLAAKSGEIVPRDELFRQVWPRSVVTEAALSSCIRELRRALEDDARQPTFIETVHRRGYRFLVPCRPEPASPGQPLLAPWPMLAATVAAERKVELEQLAHAYARLREGATRVLVVTGADGVGKSALVGTFLAGLAGPGGPAICHVACPEEWGKGDAYRPLLDALDQMGRRPDRNDVLDVLRRFAPTWLAELPLAGTPAERRSLRLRTAGATAAWMQRELADALEALSARAPLVLFIEDLHACDAATLDCLMAFARAPGRAAVLLIATARQNRDGLDAAVSSLISAIREQGRCAILELDAPAPATNSAGRHEMPEGDLRRVGDRERRVLGVASVAGTTFSVEEVAAGAGMPAEAVEETLQVLEKDGKFIRPSAPQEWPDGTFTPSFRFRNLAVRYRVREALSPPERSILHGRIGRRLASAWQDRTEEIAARLAAHFEHEVDPGPAIGHLYQAGAASRRLSAHGVAQEHFRRALVLLQGMPDGPERRCWEALLCTALGRELVSTRGFADRDVRDLYARALELQQALDAAPRLGTILWGLWIYHLNRGPLATASQLADRLLDVARALGDPVMLLDAHHARWSTALMLGEPMRVLECARSGMAVCGSTAGALPAMTRGCTLYDLHLNNHHPAICAGFFSAWAEALTGRADVAARSLDAAATHARDIGHPFTLALTLVSGSGVRTVLGDAAACRRHAAEGRAIAEDHRFDALVAWACIYEGWAIARLGDTAAGIALMDRGLAACGQTGMSLFRPFQLALAAEALLEGGEPKRAARYVEEAVAIAERVGDQLVEAELHRLRAELSIAIVGPTSRAEADLRRAVDIARRQAMTLYEGRAARALERLEGRTALPRRVILQARPSGRHRRPQPDKPA